jgi:hypothetical protein
MRSLSKKSAAILVVAIPAGASIAVSSINAASSIINARSSVQLPVTIPNATRAPSVKYSRSGYAVTSGSNNPAPPVTLIAVPVSSNPSQVSGGSRLDGKRFPDITLELMVPSGSDVPPQSPSWYTVVRANGLVVKDGCSITWTLVAVNKSVPVARMISGCSGPVVISQTLSIGSYVLSAHIALRSGGQMRGAATVKVAAGFSSSKPLTNVRQATGGTSSHPQVGFPLITICTMTALELSSDSKGAETCLRM